MQKCALADRAEYREELKDLGAIVANCTSFIFILTDNIFDS